MATAKDLLQNWLNEMGKFKFPTYERLPDIDLYMEQLNTYLDRVLAPLTLSSLDKQLTPAMINNYVKGEVIPSPNGKKYSKEHIGSLLMLNALKSVLTLNETKELTSYNTDRFNVNYNLFTKKTKDIYHSIIEDISSKINTDTKDADLASIAFDMTLECYARLTVSKRILAYLRHFNESAEIDKT